MKREAAPEHAPAAPEGLMSSFLHERATPGTTLELRTPAGDFFLDDEEQRPVVLLSGGVGLTPMLSMLDELVARDTARDVWFIHAAQSGRHHALRDHVKEVAAAHPNVRSVAIYEVPDPADRPGVDYDESGRITMDWLKQTVPVAESDFYFCGPRGFMRMLGIGLRALDVPEERIHFEYFGPAGTLYA